MAKKKVYLSELFLMELNEDYTVISLKNALKKCNNELINRLSPTDRRDNRGKTINCYQQELIDFYDVYDEFDQLLSPDEKKNFLILNPITICKVGDVK